jgi:hypothetical protein
MELGPRGVHTLLVSPGPIARDHSTVGSMAPVGGVSDADSTSSRYADQTAGLAESATRPGAGARRPRQENPHRLRSPSPRTRHPRQSQTPIRHRPTLAIIR